MITRRTMPEPTSQPSPLPLSFRYTVMRCFSLRTEHRHKGHGDATTIRLLNGHELEGTRVQARFQSSEPFPFGSPSTPLVLIGKGVAGEGAPKTTVCPDPSLRVCNVLRCRSDGLFSVSRATLARWRRDAVSPRFQAMWTSNDVASSSAK